MKQIKIINFNPDPEVKSVDLTLGHISFDKKLINVVKRGNA